MYPSITNQISVNEMRHMEDVEKMSRAEIAKKLGISTSTLVKYLGPKYARPAKADFKDVQKIIELRKQNKTYQEIADIVGLSTWTVCKYCNKNLDKIDSEKSKKLEPKKIDFKKDNEEATKDLNDYFRQVSRSEAEDMEIVNDALQNSNKYVNETENASTFTVLKDKHIIKLQGADYIYEVVIDGEANSITVTDTTGKDIMLLDRDSLKVFVHELTMLKTNYFKEG